MKTAIVLFVKAGRRSQRRKGRSMEIKMRGRLDKKQADIIQDKYRRGIQRLGAKIWNGGRGKG
jgi:hypothetical protein